MFNKGFNGEKCRGILNNFVWKGRPYQRRSDVKLLLPVFEHRHLIATLHMCLLYSNKSHCVAISNKYVIKVINKCVINTVVQHCYQRLVIIPYTNLFYAILSLFQFFLGNFCRNLFWHFLRLYEIGNSQKILVVCKISKWHVIYTATTFRVKRIHYEDDLSCWLMCCGSHDNRNALLVIS